MGFQAREGISLHAITGIKQGQQKYLLHTRVPSLPRP